MPELIRAKGYVNYDANNVEPFSDNSAFVEIRMLQHRESMISRGKIPRQLTLRRTARRRKVRRLKGYDRMNIYTYIQTPTYRQADRGNIPYRTNACIQTYGR